MTWTIIVHTVCYFKKGVGGMGEVWRAFDLKLRLDVALKALRLDRLGDRRALESLRQEVRTAREVGSPNVCRVYDLVELGGRELRSRLRHQEPGDGRQPGSETDNVLVGRTGKEAPLPSSSLRPPA
jgi:serine/threonine protein kinase